MLAYAFWHWAHRDHRRDDYERAQLAFQAVLAQAAPPGFLRSVVFRLHGETPWLGGTPAYVDWYLVDNSAALDPLNVAAVTGVCEHPHAEVARAMAAGAGSLFTLHGAEANPESARHATFVTKPRPMPYDTFYATAATFAHTSDSLWRRTMVLGPTPEFVVLSERLPSAPATLQPLTLELTCIWPNH